MVRSGPQCLDGDMGEPAAAGDSVPPPGVEDCRLVLPGVVRDPSREEDVCRSVGEYGRLFNV
jgi:hypothetical protein